MAVVFLLLVDVRTYGYILEKCIVSMYWVISPIWFNTIEHYYPCSATSTFHRMIESDLSRVAKISHRHNLSTMFH